MKPREKEEELTPEQVGSISDNLKLIEKPIEPPSLDKNWVKSLSDQINTIYTRVDE